jgi:hypothetical protein
MVKQKHYTWHARVQQEGQHFRVYYQYHYPRGLLEEERDPRRFNSLEEAEQFAEDVRRANRIYTELNKGFRAL